MKQIFFFLTFFCMAFFTVQNTFSQTSEPTWEKLSKQYELPKWYADARLGIWCHCGAQTQPEEGGGWYARHMYMQDAGGETFRKNKYPYHIKNYGLPSEVGFKNVIDSWRAERLNIDSMMKYF